MVNALHTSKPVQQKNNLPASALFFQPKPAVAPFFTSAQPIVQRQKAGEKKDDKPADDKHHLVLTLPDMDKMDYLGVNEALHYRGVLVPGAYSDDATTEWLRQHQFYKSFTKYLMCQI